MIPPKDIKPKTEYVKNVMNNERFDKYIKKEFSSTRSASTTNEVIEIRDEPLITDRLLNFKDE